ncbi:hypothetical protein L6V77_30870 [Myxococcota bacterium]|nr:hypothetical protein [Myxococcota bacterium]
MPAALWFALTTLLAAPEGGVWLPTTGHAGERAIQAMGAGGDAALYAAGGGVVYRLEPGAEWTRIGRYAPRLTWEAGGEIVAHGDLPGSLLRQVEADAEAGIETPDAGDGREVVPREVKQALLAQFVEAQAETPGSPYAVAGVVPAPQGVWIATGAGLFRATRDGLTGPRQDVRGAVHSVLHRPTETLVGTDTGLWRIPAEAPAVLLRGGRVSALTESQGSIYFLADGRIFGGATPDAAHPISAPSPQPLAMAADPGGLYLATRFAVYRRSGAQWRLCASVPTPPSRLVTGEGILHAVAADAIYLYSESCGQVSRVGAPWPGGFGFTDVARLGGLVWASANQGVFMLTPLDADTSLAVQMEGYRRAVTGIPSMDALVLRALEVHRLDSQATDVGLRPAWAQLLPELRAAARYSPRRIETLDRGTRMTEIEVTRPKPDWQVMAYWRISLDRFLGFATVSPLDYFEANALDLEDDLEAEDALDGAAIEEVFDGTTSEIVYDDEALSAGEGPEAGLLEQYEDAAISMMASEKKRVAAERTKVVTQLRRLYQQRQNLLYRLWVQRSKDLLQRTTLLLSVDELDARLSAMTGLNIRSTGRSSEEANEAK